MTTVEKLELRGERNGRAKQHQETLRTVLQTLLQQRFGTLPGERVKAIENASADTLQRWVEHVIAAPTLDDVFATTGNHNH